MEKFEGLTIAQLDAKRDELKAEGFNETEAIEVVEVGKYKGLPVSIGTGKTKSASFSVITFERTAKSGETLQLMFSGCKFNIKNLSTSKEYSEILVKVDDLIRATYTNPVNLNKEAQISATSYKDNAGRDKTALKVTSIQK